jgi:alpha-L-fucosidase 2
MRTRKYFSYALVLCFMLAVQFTNAQQGRKLKLSYVKPASAWQEALPVGNGRLGAMIYGIPAKEKIQLNELTFWSGGPSRNDNPDALAALSTIRQYIFDGKYGNAETLINQKVTAKQLHGSMYQPIGFLNLAFPDHTNYTDYYRELNLENAVFTTTYKVNGVTFKREVFASQPDQVIVVKLSASQAGQLSFTATMNGLLQKSVTAIDANTLELKGLSSTHEGVTGQVKFDARAKILNSGGTTAIVSNTIQVSNADEVVILISIATNFVDYKTITADETAKCISYLSAAELKSYTDLLNSHITAFQKYFSRVNLNLGPSTFSDFPTDARLKNFSKINDNDLVALYYQYGRYLLISCSQPGGQPANLQGLWNDQVNPSWDSKYTININTEMNYWPAEKCNLTEMGEPLVKMIDELSEAGKQTAGDMYGCDGWVTHHNTDIWRICGVVDGAYWGMWPMGGAWLSQYLWEKYLYNGNLTYLDSVYPVLKSACEFYQDFLIEEPLHKWLVVSPSVSPENNPIDFHASSICAGATMDNQILFDLFTKTIKAASLLKKDSILMVDFKSIRDKLPPMQIGRLGQLQEWMDDWDSPNDQNRHVSHLYGLFPGNQISPYTAPALFDAARTSLKYRGDVSTGWSMGWKVNFWARFQDGNHARKLITDQLTYVAPSNTTNGGTYPNLFDAHPPFQIDGNFGCTSGITEMLLQSHDGAIHFLPALPDDWTTGEIKGLKAYGGFDVSFNWDDGKVQKIIIKSNLGGNCRIRVPNEVTLINDSMLKPASGVNTNPFFAKAEIKNPLIVDTSKLNPVILKSTLLYDLPTKPGETYTIICVKEPKFHSAFVTNKNPKQILVNLSETIKKQDQFNGFTVKLDNQVTDIDSVVLGDTSNQLVINLKESISKENEVLLAYSNGNVVSINDLNLINFSDTLVDNLLPGASPIINELESSDDGNTLIIRFNNKMKIPADLSVLTLSAEYNGEKVISILQSSFLENDSTILSFSLANQVYADYKLSLSYSGNTIVSSDSGFLKQFSDLPIINFSKGLPLQLLSGKVDSIGSTIVLEFNKKVALALEQSDYFKLTVNGKAVSIKELKYSNTISIVPSIVIHFGDVILLSYTPGKITSFDKGDLESFSDFAITNSLKEPTWTLIPGTIEAENYCTQLGTQTESTDDTGGGMDVSGIDAADWLQYAINNTSSDTMFSVSFRLASPTSGGTILVYLDEVNISSVTCPNTTGWQVFKSITKDFKIKPGKHYLRLYASKGGFNINYIDFTKPTSINGIIGSEKILIYPNPLSKEISIESAGFNYNKVEISDLEGNVVLSRSIAYAPLIHFPIGLPAGMYIVKLSNNKQFKLLKIIVMNN